MGVEEQKKLIERYKGLIAAKEKAKAPDERIRLFRNKLKMHQRRLAKIQPKKKSGEEGEAAKPAEAAKVQTEDKK